MVAFTSSFTVTDFNITQPLDGAVITDGTSLTLQAEGTNLQGVNSVAFLVDDVLSATAQAQPFTAAYAVNVGAAATLNLHARAVLGGANLALTATLAASSQTFDYAFVPERAADGNTDSDITHGSVSVVIGETVAWWQADLGQIEVLDTINVHLMTGCCETANRFAVLVADTPFDESDFTAITLPAAFVNGASLVYETGADYDQGIVTITPSISGRYIRIVGLAERHLNLAEVEIFEPRWTVDSPQVQVQVQP